MVFTEFSKSSVPDMSSVSSVSSELIVSSKSTVSSKERIPLFTPRSTDTILLCNAKDNKYYIESLIDSGSPISLLKERIQLPDFNQVDLLIDSKQKICIQVLIVLL